LLSFPGYYEINSVSCRFLKDLSGCFLFSGIDDSLALARRWSADQASLDLWRTACHRRPQRRSWYWFSNKKIPGCLVNYVPTTLQSVGWTLLCPFLKLEIWEDDCESLNGFIFWIQRLH
jgi:hypothetical protein